MDDALTDGTCGSLSCEACNASLGWTTSLSDSSACTTGETSCAANHRLVERDASGNVTENFCEGCPSGQFITTIDTHVSGQFYKASPYECQTCPDADMAYSSAEKACTCTTGARLRLNWRRP